MIDPAPETLLPYCPTSLTEQLLTGGPRILLYGEAGIGKSYLVNELARIFAEKGLSCSCITADPGSPLFGLPGTVSLGQWRKEGWQVSSFEALCSLDAGRFRLPLLTAVGRLSRKVPTGLLLVDSPGVVRGIAGAEWLTGVAELLNIDTVLVLNRRSKPLPLRQELSSLGIHILAVHAHPDACHPGQTARTRKRTERWRAYLETLQDIAVHLDDLHLIGAPPPIDVPAAWNGRQCAFVEPGRTVSIGEIVALEQRRLRIRLPRAASTTGILLVRDARSEKNGLLVSARPFTSGNLQFLPPPDALPYRARDDGGGPRPVARLRGGFATMINGVFGDPLLHLRLRQRQRSLLFDLGDSGRLPTRIAHQVNDVFISHAHIDHIGGFLWLLRSRFGDFPSCRLYGPPGLAAHIRGLIAGVLWDRIGDARPRFEIVEIHGDRLRRTRLQAGLREGVALPEVPLANGIVLDDPLFRVRTATLDHLTQVQAYAFESKPSISVDSAVLKAMGLPPGPWLNRLKALIGKGDGETMMPLPDGNRRKAAEVAAQLLIVRPGEKLVYATDLADTAANRKALSTLAERSDFFFCEAAFLEDDADQAQRTGHLTARACGEIANLADVKQLVPFHFSRRYENRPEAVYREIGAVCSRVVTPAQSGKND